MQCPNCHNEVPEGTKFCGECGAMINENSQPTKESAPYTSAPAKDSKNTLMLVIIIVLALCFILMIIGLAGWLVYSSSSSQKTDEIQVTVVTDPTPVPTPVNPAPPVHQPPAQPQIVRGIDAYSSAYTYKRMPEIHSSVLTSDSTFASLADVIRDFNAKCESYMNYGTNDIFTYLKPGTTAYNQQVDYKSRRKGINVRYLTVDIQNARQNDSYYYVWVYEEIQQTLNGKTTITNDHWVYKLQYNGNNYVILDYTADPAYEN